jgi:hypothetical protein
MHRSLHSPFLVAALALAVVLVPLGTALPTPPVLEPWHDARDLRLEAGMGTLLSWGALNVTAGVVGRLTTGDRRLQGFWEMNLGWGLVNSGLAIASLVGGGADPETRGALGASLEASHDLALVFWVNTGLDVAYMAAGAWLWERGNARAEPRTVGFGQSLIVQGAFLFAFDLVMALLEGDAAGELYPLVGPAGVGLGGNF